MNESDNDVFARIKKSLTTCLQHLEKEPVILIDAKGKYWANSMAREVISQRDVSLKDFVEWIGVGAFHLQDMEYRNLQVHICRLPKKDVIALLKPYFMDSGVKKKMSLTRKEKEILYHVLKGFTNKKIASRLRISPATVNAHLDNVYAKLGSSSRLEASLFSLKHGLLVRSPIAPSEGNAK
jgi:DNA-binding CsgD family transcriptional regulator